MRGLFIRSIECGVRQALIDIGYTPVKQDIYFLGTMVTSDGKLWHPAEPFMPDNCDGSGWAECKEFYNADEFLKAAKEMLKEKQR